jgi:hypothetical protein
LRKIENSEEIPFFPSNLLILLIDLLHLILNYMRDLEFQENVFDYLNTILKKNKGDTPEKVHPPCYESFFLSSLLVYLLLD